MSCSANFETCTDLFTINTHHGQIVQVRRTSSQFSLSPSQSLVSLNLASTRRHPSSKLNKEIEDEVKAFTARSTGQPTDQDFLELENNVRELRTKYCKSGSVASKKDGDCSVASSVGQREVTPESSGKVRGHSSRETGHEFNLQRHILSRCKRSIPRPCENFR